MGEVVNVLVAFAVIIFLFRWVTSGMGSQLCSRNTALTVSPLLLFQEILQMIHPDPGRRRRCLVLGRRM